MVRVYDYTDYRAFVRDWLADRNGRPSLRTLAARAGFSAAKLSGLLHAKSDLTDDQATKLGRALELDPDAERFFLDLVDLEQTAPRGRRLEALARVTARRRFNDGLAIGDAAWAVFERWFYAPVLELTRLDGFREDPAWIADVLDPRITSEEAQEALDVLVRVGLLVRVDGRLVPSADTIRTDHHVARLVGLTLTEHHRWMLARAAAAILAVPGAERQYGTTTVALSDAAFRQVRAAAARFQEEILAIQTSDTDAKTRVVQVGSQVFPLTRRGPS